MHDGVENVHVTYRLSSVSYMLTRRNDFQSGFIEGGMGFSLKSALSIALVALTLAAHAQEGYPLDGTWRGSWGADNRMVVIVMKWDGKTINGTINPGPNSVPFTKASLEPSNWTVHIEAQGRDGAPISIDATLEDIGSYNRTLTGTWKQAGADHAFKIARE
jgi:hypothetical protein